MPEIYSADQLALLQQLGIPTLRLVLPVAVAADVVPAQVSQTDSVVEVAAGAAPVQLISTASFESELAAQPLNDLSASALQAALADVSEQIPEQAPEQVSKQRLNQVSAQAPALQQTPALVPASLLQQDVLWALQQSGLTAAWYQQAGSDWQLRADGLYCEDPTALTQPQMKKVLWQLICAHEQAS